MSKVLVTESYLTDIGDAIRNKNGSTTKYKPGEMANAIKNIAGSSGDSIEFLNYIELKNQYIDTGITPEPAYLYSYSFNVQDNKDYVALLGCRIGSGYSKSFGILQTPESGKIRLDFDDPDIDGSSTTFDVSNSLESHPIYRFYGNDTQIYAIYATVLSSSYNLQKKSIKASTTSGLTASIYLGAYHRQDNNSAIFANPDLKIYGFRITNSDIPIGNFIPASFNGLKGMYETVKNQFHGVDGTITPVRLPVSLTVSVPSEDQTIEIDLNNGQWVDSGTQVDGHTVYKSDAGSYNIDNGKSTCTIKVSGYSSVTVYARSYAESNYDYLEVGPLDSTITRGSSSNVLTTQGKQSSTTYLSHTFTIEDKGQHTFQILYSKDSSFNRDDDRGYFYLIAE